MINIQLSNIPNQSLSFISSNNYYNIKLYVCNNTPLSPDTAIMACDIEVNNTPIITGFRLVPGAPLIPYPYLFDGNFILLTRNQEYPNYNFFGINQFLIYASQEEIEAIVNG
jgi:hypothetical protein